jgi:hypothetical protein
LRVQKIQLRTEVRENGDLGAVAPQPGVLDAAVIWYKHFTSYSKSFLIFGTFKTISDQLCQKLGISGVLNPPTPLSVPTVLRKILFNICKVFRKVPKTVGARGGAVG